MAKGKQTGGVQWLPGQSGNPLGRPKKSKSMNDIQNKNAMKFQRYVDKYLNMSYEKMKKLIAEPPPKMTLMEILVLRILSHAITGGDHVRFDYLLTRLFGKTMQAKPQKAAADKPSTQDAMARLKEEKRNRALLPK